LEKKSASRFSSTTQSISILKEKNRIDIDWVVEENLDADFISKLVYEELYSFLSKYEHLKFVVKTP